MRPTDLGSISACRAEIIPTDDEIGAAELYHYEVVLRTSLGGEAAPPWLQDLVDNVRLTGQAVERIEQRVDEIVDTLRLTRRTVERTSAVVDNMRIANSNIELAKNTGSTSYRAKRKEVCCVRTLVVCYIDPFTFWSG